MGNLCGKESKSDHFATPGRTLNDTSAAPASGRAPVPKTATGPGRTLGGSPGGDAGDARRAAAQAAEERARASQPKGKLGAQLAAQKQQSRVDTLGQASRDELAARDDDQAREARDWN